MLNMEAIKLTNRKARGRIRVVREERIEPTPETLAKLMPPNLAHLRPEYQRAACEIEMGYRLIVAEVGTRSATLGEGSKGDRGDWRTYERDAVGSYRRWVGELARRRLPTAAMLEIIVDGRHGWEIDKAHGWRAGMAAEFLIEALEIFCRQQRRAA